MWPSAACLCLSVVEWTTTRWVDLTVTILGCTYGIGHMALGGLAFVLRDWRALNLALSTPFFAFFLISWWVQGRASSPWGKHLWIGGLPSPLPPWLATGPKMPRAVQRSDGNGDLAEGGLGIQSSRIGISARVLSPLASGPAAEGAVPRPPPPHWHQLPAACQPHAHITWGAHGHPSQ